MTSKEEVEDLLKWVNESLETIDKALSNPHTFPAFIIHYREAKKMFDHLKEKLQVIIEMS